MDLEDNSVENRKVNDCMTRGRSSGLQRSDRETARITQDKQSERGTDTKTSTNTDINRERETRMEQTHMKPEARTTG